MYTINEYHNLISKYGSYASWAIWDKKNQGDPAIIDNNISLLHSKYVLLGLNISGLLANTPWLNFHLGPSNVRKIKYACTDNAVWGAYITDLFKDIPEKDSSKLRNMLTEDVIYKNVEGFNEEMHAIKMSPDSIFVVFGGTASYYFNTYFREGYKNPVVYHHHYSHYGVSDREWVISLWKKLNINQDYDLTVNRYKGSD